MHILTSSIRRTRPADLPALFEIRARTRENALDIEYLATLGITPASSAAAMLNGQVQGWLCEMAGQIVGFASGDRDSGEMLVLAVLPEYEGRGIGKRLLTEVVSWLVSCGCPRIWLTANRSPSGRAYGFYRHCGWRPTGELVDGDEVLEYFTVSSAALPDKVTSPLELVDVNRDNWQQCAALSVTAAQQALFPCSVLGWIAESRFEPSFRLHGLSVDAQLIGFAVTGVDPEDGEHWLLAFVIDAPHQGQGFGRAGMQALLAYFSAQRACRRILLGHRPENLSAARLYASFGFVPLRETPQEIICSLQLPR
ncbi:GNAT family N-acetyltransferase [Andreprevotia lacus]|nr:GNAT family N-acetyltransferase [Andreprevotia lacus]